jgi:hypothetical protein
MGIKPQISQMGVGPGVGVFPHAGSEFIFGAADVPSNRIGAGASV